MDHQKAERARAADRYLLGELSDTEREEFEEHFFSCPECASEVRAGALFRANARAVFLDESMQPAHEGRESEHAGWLGWLGAQPAMAASWVAARMRPAMAVAWATTCVLLLLTGYQRLVVVPRLRTELAQVSVPQPYEPFTLRTVTRGDDLTLEVPRSARFVGLTLHLDPQYKFRAYRAEFAAESGASRFSVTAASPRAAGLPLCFLVPVSSLPIGGYTMVLQGLDSVSQEQAGEKIGTYRFLVKRK